jgi:hypothetical protein
MNGPTITLAAELRRHDGYDGAIDRADLEAAVRFAAFLAAAGLQLVPAPPAPVQWAAVPEVIGEEA